MFNVWLYVNKLPSTREDNETSVSAFNDDTDVGNVCGIHILLTLSYVNTCELLGGFVETSTSVRESSDKILI